LPTGLSVFKRSETVRKFRDAGVKDLKKALPNCRIDK
jgi:hypothetical protein